MNNNESRRYHLSAAALAAACMFLLSGCAEKTTSTPPPPANEPPPGAEIVHPSDGALMVYVPAGEFTMGLDPTDANNVARDLGFADPDTLWAWESYPKRKVNVPGYFIDKYEVTVQRWRRFAKATDLTTTAPETSRHFDRPDKQLLPAAAITWSQAKQYAAWAGKALPTEPQWEKAARGPDARLYPWGNQPPTSAHGHFGAKAKLPTLYTLVGTYPQGASPYGVLDMLGNQYEWTSQYKLPYPGNPHAEKMIDPTGAKYPCLRGGSWYHGWVSFYAAKRFGLEPDETYYHIGFRTVWTPPPGYFQSQNFTRDQAAVSPRQAEIDKMRQLVKTKM